MSPWMLSFLNHSQRQLLKIAQFENQRKNQTKRLILRAGKKHWACQEESWSKKAKFGLCAQSSHQADYSKPETSCVHVRKLLCLTLLKELLWNVIKITKNLQESALEILKYSIHHCGKMVGFPFCRLLMGSLWTNRGRFKQAIAPRTACNSCFLLYLQFLRIKGTNA